MKSGSTPPPPPDDEAADPLLAALRQRLGDYGQAPPPGAWAAIRQRVAPPPVPQPWWRRPRRLLPLLGLLAGLLSPSILTENQLKTANYAATELLASPASHPTIAATGKRAADRTNSFSSGASASISQPPAAARGTSSSILNKESSGDEETVSASASKLNAHASNSATASTIATVRARSAAKSHLLGDIAIAPTSERTTSLATAEKRPRHQPTKLAIGRAGHHPTHTKQIIIYQAATISASKQPIAAAKQLAAQTKDGKAADPRIVGKAASTASKTHHYAGTAPVAEASSFASRSHHAAQQSRSRHPLATADQTTAETTTNGLTSPAASYSAGLPSSGLPSEAVDLLAWSQPALLLPGPPLPTLVAHPDSSKPRQLARRWSMLVVAGPTLSYRTLGPAPTLAAGHPDFAQLERPALGLGAQVQVRRVLSGRWALAVGLGYHEYATRLALTLKDSSYSVHQRDTYRLLTVPVQLSYALGVPAGRLAKGLLLGIEPGWYVGGRSTEGADCGCHQQTYSATSSPYRTWSLALSLGLDLRYRLGGVDSRWQWLVQPTGRYVATPFVRSDAVGFTRRQPFSVGLLTGFSWDIR